jgi:EF hand
MKPDRRTLPSVVAVFATAAMIATLSGGASAQSRDTFTIVVATWSDLADSSRTMRTVGYVTHPRQRYVARHGVYYAPRILVYAPRPVESTDDDFDDMGQDEFDYADANNDGFISLREARRSHSDWARDFRKIDTSGDGYLTREEVEAFYGGTPPTQ